MADVSKIKLPSGTTYNIKDTVSGYTTNTGTITKVQTTAGAHTTINVSSGAATFNVPTKTSHLTNDSGFLTSHQTLYEANLNWGGKNFSASYGPIDAAMIGQLGANRFAFLKAAGLTIEYSTDGGSSWTDYGATNTQKTGLFGYGQSFYLGKHTAAGSSTLNDQLRVTIATSAAGLYTTLNKIAIYMSTSGNTVQVKIERALESTPTTYTTHLDWTGISGWSGWNILNITGLTTYGNAPASQNGRVRFTFKQTAVTTTYSAASISQIMGFGGVGWSVPSNMARDGHLYKYDNDQNATFPAKVTATSFSGPLTGDVTGNVTGNVSGTATNVTGTVAIANGGTGQTTAANAINALLNGLPTWTADPTDTTYFIRQDTGGSASYGKVQATTLWNYISGKLPAWSKASTKPSYNFSEIGSTPTTLSGYGITDAKIASGVITLGNNTITPLTSSSTLSAAKLSGAIPSAVTATTQASTDNSTKIATTAYVTTAIANLPEPMVFKGSVGTGGTITSLPTAASSNEGHTYKVITALSSPSAKVGDTVISNGSSWVVIPSGDEPSGTVTSVAVSNGGGLSVSGSPVTSSGTITISHADTSSQASSSNSGRTYIQSLTLDTYGHVTGISTATETVTNTDTKLQVAEATSATQYYPLIGTGTTAATRQYDTTGFKYKGTTGTTSAVGSAVLELGNSTASGTAGNKQGQLIVYGTNAKKATITLAAPSADVALALPTSGGTLALASQIPSVPSVTGSSTTGITASTTATKTTLGTASSIYGVKSGTNSTTTASKASGSNGSASTWAFEEVSIPNVTAAGSASTWTFGSTTVGDGTLIGAVDSSDSSMLVITAGTKSVQQKTGGANGSAPTLGTAIKVQSKKSGSNGTAPSWSFTDVTVPIRNDSATSVPSVSVASATVSVTDPGHTHSI